MFVNLHFESILHFNLNCQNNRIVIFKKINDICKNNFHDN